MPTRGRKSFKNTEAYLQAQCVLLVKRAMRKNPDLNYLATMTEGQRNPARAAVAKMMGLRKGPSDLLLIRRNEAAYEDLRPFNLPIKLAWIEFKLPGKNLTPEQRDWHEWFAEVAECHLVTSKEQFASILAAF